MTKILGTRSFWAGGWSEYCINATGREYANLIKEGTEDARAKAENILNQFATDLKNYGNKQKKEFSADMLGEFLDGVTGQPSFCGTCKDKEGCQYKPKE